jgi:hypothetical protein
VHQLDPPRLTAAVCDLRLILHSDARCEILVPADARRLLQRPEIRHQLGQLLHDAADLLTGTDPPQNRQKQGRELVDA